MLNNCFADGSLADVKSGLFDTPRTELLRSSYLVPLLGDYLFRTYLPQHCSDSVNMHLGVLMFCDFCRWLARLHLTRI